KFTFNNVTQVREANYVANQGDFIVSVNNSDELIELNPQKRFYSTSNPMTEAAIDSTLGRDLFISLGEDLGSGSWSVRIYLKSFVACIWLGGFIMALGGFIAILDRRYRKVVKPETKIAADNTASASDIELTNA
nr:c-type cytochrome biogenesis protein CcmF [Acidiferrobacterales bacterium]